MTCSYTNKKKLDDLDRKGGFTRTFSGIKFWPIDPRPEEIAIEDIAHGLSLMNRYNGHTPRPYSVAQHSVLVSEACNPKDALWGLLHDASEAYIADIVAPAKASMPEYKQVEKNLMLAVCRKFWLSPEQPKSVSVADKKILATEIRDIFGENAVGDFWNVPEKPVETKIKILSWQQAEQKFLARFRKLWPAHLAEVQKKLAEMLPE